MAQTARELALYLRDLYTSVTDSYDKAFLSGELTEAQYAAAAPFARGMAAIVETAERRTGLRPEEDDDPEWNSWT